jgi:TadE-like protein
MSHHPRPGGLRPPSPRRPGPAARCLRAWPWPRWSRGRGARGAASIELLGFLPVLLLVALAGVQLGLVAYAGVQAGTGARAAARTAGLDDPRSSPEAAGRAAMSGWLADGSRIGVAPRADAVTATVSLDIPSVIPGVDLFGPVERSATMPREEGAP